MTSVVGWGHILEKEQEGRERERARESEIELSMCAVHMWVMEESGYEKRKNRWVRSIKLSDWK